MRKQKTPANQYTGGIEMYVRTWNDLDEYSRNAFVRQTYLFAGRVMSDPELREKVKQRAAEIRAAETEKHSCK